MAFVSTFDHSKMNELQKHQERNKVLIMMAREQLMEDIEFIMESNFGEVEYKDDVIRQLCDAVCKNFPTN